MEIGLTELEWPAVRCWEARDSAAVVDAGSGACGASASATWAVLRACTAGRTAPAATAATRMVPGVERGENREVPRVVVRVPLRENGTVSGSPRPCRGTVTSLVSTTGPAAQWGSCRRDLSVIGPSQHSEPSHGRAAALRRPDGRERASSPNSWRREVRRAGPGCSCAPSHPREWAPSRGGRSIGRRAAARRAARRRARAPRPFGAAWRRRAGPACRPQRASRSRSASRARSPSSRAAVDATASPK